MHASLTLICAAHVAIAVCPAITGRSLAAQRTAQRTAPPAGAREAPAGWSDFTRALDAYADGARIVGTSALVMRDGRVVARHHRGHADRAGGRRVDDRTIFHWGSITKTLTAIAIMQLRDRGRLSLDDRVVRWVPELRRMHDPFGAIDSITVRMLLSHSAGFQAPTWPYGAGHRWEPFEPTTWEQLVAMMPYQRLLFPPGTRASYSNPAFIYLARIIEQLSGDPWGVYVQKNIFAPLGLSRSYFGNTPYHLAGERSHNYDVRRDSATGRDTVVDNGADFDPGITMPNSGWNSPLDDVAGYMAFLVGAPRDPAEGARHEVVLSRRSLEEMWRPLHPLGSQPASGNTRMGLSFFVSDAGGTRLVGHTGSQAGFRAYMYVNPAARSGVLIAFNTGSAAAGVQPPLSEVLERGLALIR
jgi:CubicO group peptidase (beta-lactamase class C family)